MVDDVMEVFTLRASITVKKINFLVKLKFGQGKIF